MHQESHPYPCVPIFLLTCAALVALASATPCLAVELFGPRIGLRTGDGPSHAVRADFDGNGVPDFAVANWEDSSVSVMLGDGLGGFDETPDIVLSSSLSSIAAGDFNADGIADLVVTQFFNHSISLLLGDGTGSFAYAAAFPTGIYPFFVAAGDFDFDGDEDLAVADSGQDTVSVLLCDGNGGFTAAATIPVGTVPRFVAIADLDGNGIPDLAVANSSSDSISILLGDGSGGFDPAEAIFVGEDRAPTAVTADDLDLDGNADLAVAHGADDSLGIWLGDGTGSFHPAQEILDEDAETSRAPVWIAAGDFDGDGDPDLAVANLGGDSVTVLRGDALALQAGTPGFTETAEISLPASPRSLVVDDFTVDGALDLAVVLAGSDMVTILPGDGFGGFLPVVEIRDIPLRLRREDRPTADVLAADFDGDGDIDIAVASLVANSVMLVPRHDDGYFDVENMTAVEVSAPTSLAAGDFDGDGNLDLAVTAGVQDFVRILLGDGEGGLAPGQQASTGVEPVALASGDFDLDGDPDLAVANSGDGTVTALSNDGSGGFPDADSRTVSAGDHPYSVASADLDGDGALDLAVANAGSDQVSIHWGDGNGSFAELVGAGIVSVGDRPISVVAGDFDGDQQVDLAVANRQDGTVSILSRDGQGHFAETLKIPVGEWPESLAVADLNLDGLDDLACALRRDHSVGVLISDGAGGFAPMPVFHSGPEPVSLAAADLDADGASDLVAAHALRDSLSLLFNRIHDRVDPDGSNRVDGLDIAEIIRLRGGTGQKRLTYRRTHDIDLNGVIDGDDLALVAAHFGVLMKTSSPLRPELESTVPSMPDTVTLQPAQREADPPDLLTLEVRVNDTNDGVSSAAFAVAVESDAGEPGHVMEYVAFEIGDYIQGPYSVEPDGTGKVRVVVERIPSRNEVGSGDQSILDLKFRARRVGTATLDFAPVDGRAAPSLLDASGSPVAGVSFHGGGLVNVAATDSDAVGQKIGFAPALLRFEDTPPGVSTKKRLRLSNFGFSDLTILGATSTLSEFVSFFVSPFTISPFGSVELPVKFAAANEGSFAAELIVASDDPQRPEVRVPLLGRSDPSITVTPSHVAFGTVVLGETARRRVGIGNRGNAPLILTGASATNQEFSVRTQIRLLNPGEYGDVEIEFEPGARVSTPHR